MIWTRAKRAAFARKMKLARQRARKAGIRRKNPAKRYRVYAGKSLIRMSADKQAALNFAKGYARLHRTVRVRVYRI